MTHHMRTLKTSLVLVGALAVLLLAPTALAATATVTTVAGPDNDVLLYDGGVDAQNTSITFNPGGVPDFRIRETGSFIGAGPNCSKISSDTVSCPSAGVGFILAALGGSDDRIDVSEAIVLKATLEGENGDDVLLGGGGNDLVRGGNGVDTLRGRAGNDELIGQGGVVGVDANDLEGGAGNDLLRGDAGTETFRGGAGDDVIIGFAGADDISGGPGAADWASFSNLGGGNQGVTADPDGNADDGLPSQGANVRPDIENIEGSNGPDEIVGGTGPNELRGLSGDDELSGGPGLPGPDILNGGGGRDLASYGGRTEPLTLRTATIGSSTANGAAGEGDVLASIEDLRGGFSDDLLIGDLGANALDGAAGDDSLDGRAGDDTLIGGPDSVNANPRGDTAEYSSRVQGLQASLATGQATLGSEQDTLSGIENLTGGSAADTLEGNASTNVLRGGPAGDTLRGLDGSDLLSPGPGVVSDTIEGGAGTDTLDYSDRSENLVVDLLDAQGAGGQGAQGEEDLVATIENVIGGSGNDVLIGDQLANSLLGGGGNDLVDGGAGSDDLFGNDGADRIEARDGESDDVSCGAAADVAIVDAAGDSIDPGCEGIDLPGAPETTLSPASIAGSSATFTFSANEVGSRFSCSLDGAAFAPCSSPRRLDGLAEGNHVFRVRATDPGGTVDPTPAQRTFTIVDTDPPDLAITSRRLRLDRSGRVPVKLTCDAAEPEPCSGKLTMRSVRGIKTAAERRRVLLARKRFEVPADATERVRLRLTRGNQRLVRGVGRLKVELTANAADSAGNRASVVKKLTLSAGS